MVWAARKEDTYALVALKVVSLSRLKRKRMEHHLITERAIGAEITALGSPFLCGLLYACISGTELCQALPFYSGGTLQVHIGARTTTSQTSSRCTARPLLIGSACAVRCR